MPPVNVSEEAKTEYGFGNDEIIADECCIPKEMW
jgi:hypothetical protein